MAKAAAEPQQVMVALTSFVGAVGELQVPVRQGDIYAADDPLVRRYPALFTAIVPRRSVAGPRVEQATAAPGEKRGA